MSPLLLRIFAFCVTGRDLLYPFSLVKSPSPLVIWVISLLFVGVSHIHIVLGLIVVPHVPVILPKFDGYCKGPVSRHTQESYRVDCVSHIDSYCTSVVYHPNFSIKFH